MRDEIKYIGKDEGENIKLQYDFELGKEFFDVPGETLTDEVVKKFRETFDLWLRNKNHS
jgi:hypothetical protein